MTNEFNFSSRLQDDEILNQLRQLVQNYVKLKRQNQLTKTQSDQIKKQFTNLQSKLHDPVLRDYSHFELLEKLVSAELTDRED